MFQRHYLSIFISITLTCTLLLIGCELQQPPVPFHLERDARLCSIEYTCTTTDFEDTLFKVAIYPQWDSVCLVLPSQVDLGISVEKNQQLPDHVGYNITYYKLKRPMGGTYATRLTDTALFHPTEKHVKEAFSNHVIQMINASGDLRAVVVPQLNDLRTPLFGMSWFQDLDADHYVLTRYVNDGSDIEMDVLSASDSAENESHN